VSVSRAKSKEDSGVSKKIKELSAKYPYFKKHIMDFKEEKNSVPEFAEEIKEETKFELDNVVYPLEGGVYAHVYDPTDEISRYYIIQPSLDSREKELFDEIKDEIIVKISDYPTTEDLEEYEKILREIFEDTIEVTEGGEPRKETNGPIGGILGEKTKFLIPKRVHDKIWFQLRKDLVGLGPLEPITMDRRNEDIHVLGYDKVNVNHAIYGMLRTNIDLGSEGEYRSWLESLTKRVGSSASESNPIIDTTLPDGSRLNVVYSEEVSVEGPTLTIRQHEEVPFSLFQIVQSGTMSPELIAYLWLSLESNMSIAVCGETASGKTTSMNAMTACIPRDTKIYSAEDTLEVRPPHDSWQRLLTRDTDDEEEEGVDMFSLIKNSLRSRPGYILVGEVRGEEGFNVFQAMQTGHPVIFTFHAGTVSSLIDRFTGDPINVPVKFFDNLDVALFQNFMKSDVGEGLRRVTGVHEIEGYSKDLEGIMSRKAFERDPAKDELDFLSLNNSYLLEEEVAPSLGYQDKRKIYDELKKRADIVRKAIREGYTGWHEVVKVTWSYQEDGEDGLPFIIS